MHQVCGRVIKSCIQVPILINNGMHLGLNPESTLVDTANMQEGTGRMFLCLLHLEACVTGFQYAGIANLAARLGVEWRMIKNHDAQVAFIDFFNGLTVLSGEQV